MNALTDSLNHHDIRHIHAPHPVVQGRLKRVVGLTMEAVGFRAPIGHTCELLLEEGQCAQVEVVGFNGSSIFLMPIKPIHGVQVGARVVPDAKAKRLFVSDALLGRVVDGLGSPLDHLGEIAMRTDGEYLVKEKPINPLKRAPISEALDVGIRALNALVPVGKGQRLGLFAGSGVGKSVLLGMMTRFTKADIVIVALIGERGREVKEFIEHSLGEEGLRRAIVVASPADDSPLMRLRASHLAHQLAEYYRNKGKDVLLLMDSLTRYAQAQREIALAVGEPPATKGYPPSVFARLPQLVERAGNGEKDSGSITAFYTVLTEGDDLQDPIADAARAILDGHIVLSRQLAESGIYPAINVSTSVSRVISAIVKEDQLRYLQRFKQLLAIYDKNRDLVNIGAYVKGTDPEVDMALSFFPHLQKFIQQGMFESTELQAGLVELQQLMNNAFDSGEAV